MKYLIIIFFAPLLMGFIFEGNIKDWELELMEVTAEKIHKRKELFHSRETCILELDSGKFPFNCLKLIKEMKNLSINISDQEGFSRINWSCVRHINKTYDLKRLVATVFIDDELNACKKEITKRVKLLKYKLGK